MGVDRRWFATAATQPRNDGGAWLLPMRHRWRGFRHCEPRSGAAIHPVSVSGWIEDGLPRLLRSLAMTGFYAGEFTGEGFLEEGLFEVC